MTTRLLVEDAAADVDVARSSGTPPLRATFCRPRHAAEFGRSTQDSGWGAAPTQHVNERLTGCLGGPGFDSRTRLRLDLEPGAGAVTVRSGASDLSWRPNVGLQTYLFTRCTL